MVSLLVILLVTLFVSFLIETLVEYLFAPFFDHFEKMTKYKWMQMYIAFAVGIAAAFIYRLDLIYILSAFWAQASPAANVALWPVTTFGMIITGAAIGRGSNYLHDIFQTFFLKSNPTEALSGSGDITQPSASSEDKVG